MLGGAWAGSPTVWRLCPTWPALQSAIIAPGVLGSIAHQGGLHLGAGPGQALLEVWVCGREARPGPGGCERVPRRRQLEAWLTGGRGAGGGGQGGDRAPASLKAAEGPAARAPISWA